VVPAHAPLAFPLTEETRRPGGTDVHQPAGREAANTYARCHHGGEAGPGSGGRRRSWALGKFYHFGGLHVGFALAGTVWYLTFVAMLIYDFAAGTGGVNVADVAVAAGSGHRGYRMTVSRAGDWTARLIDNPPGHIWVRGIPTVDIVVIKRLFSKVVIVATGSGIGPALGHLLSAETPAQLVWATRDATKTYGAALVDEILTAQPEAIIWNTDELGRPDMLRLAYRAYITSGAEAVICISNKTLTWNVVHGLERRGIPAFGPVWDS
jgi:hypothetical protein